MRSFDLIICWFKNNGNHRRTFTFRKGSVGSEKISKKYFPFYKRSEN
jgi:hypothetical protein